jgi:hypothetical protein
VVVTVVSSVVAPAVSNGEVILIIVFVTIPVAAIAFIANAGNAFRSIGKGGLSVEFESDNPQGMRDSGAEAEPSGAREDELRQMLEAKAYRQSARGETPLDVEQELARVLAEKTIRRCARRCASSSSPATSAAPGRARNPSTSTPRSPASCANSRTSGNRRTYTLGG